MAILSNQRRSLKRIKPGLANLVNYAHVAAAAAFSRSTGAPLVGCPRFDLLVTGPFWQGNEIECGSLIIKWRFVDPMYLKSCTLNKPDGLDLSSAVIP